MDFKEAFNNYVQIGEPIQSTANITYRWNIYTSCHKDAYEQALEILIELKQKGILKITDVDKFIEMIKILAESLEKNKIIVYKDTYPVYPYYQQIYYGVNDLLPENPYKVIC